MAAQSQVQVEDNHLSTAKLLLVFSSLSLALLISFVDQNAIGVALPTLGAELRASNTISWAATSSLIANTVFQVLCGRMSDLMGRKLVLLFSIGFSTIGNLLCGFARDGPQLYVFRGIVGMGHAGIAALAMIIVSDSVSLERRGKYQGILGACVGIGSATGPFLAAAIIDSWTWRGLFWVICSLCATAGIISALTIPPSVVTGTSREKLRSIDYGGILSSSIGLILLLIPISGGGVDFAWDSAMAISMLSVGSVLFVVFILIEWRWAAMPLLPLKFFTNPPVCAIMIQNVCIGCVYYSNLYFMPIYYQNVRLWSVMDAAILTIPFVASQSILSVLSGQYISRLKRYGEVIWFGYGLLTLGSGLTLLIQRETARWIIIVIMIIMGAGVGSVFQPTLVAAQAHTDKEDRAVVITVRNFTRSIGGAVGLAVSTALFSNQVRSGISHLPDKIQEPIRTAILSVPNVDDLSIAERESVLNAYTSASRAVFIMWIALMAFCLMLCSLVKDRGLSRPEKATT